MHAVRFSVVLGGLAIAIFASACAGATDTEFFAPAPTGTQLSKNEPTQGTSNTKTPGDTKTKAPADGDIKAADPKTPGTIQPGGSHPEPRPIPGTDPTGGNPQPVTDDCIPEVEGNDSPGEATPFTACINGQVGANGDIDFLKVVAPPGAKKMTIEHNDPDGRVQYRVMKEGDLMNLLLDTNVFFDNSPELPVTEGATYLFRVSSPMFNRDARERGYEIRVTFSE
jgi:hypothetical protein